MGLCIQLRTICDNIMIDSSRKQTALYARANHQLREIEAACRQVTIFARQLNTFSVEVPASQVNCRKVETLKSDIRDKLKEYASNIDAIYQLLEQIKKVEARTLFHSYCKRCQSATTNVSVSHMSDEFSQTLNPRIMRLESKISEYQVNQMKLRRRISELQAKNAALIEQYRLSSNSNNKFCQVNTRSTQENPENQTISRSLSKNMASPKTSLQFSSSKRKLNFIHTNSEQTSYETSFACESRSRLHNFGSISSSPKSITSLRGSSRDEEEKNDRSRRFDLLLNKLRDSQQESTEGSRGAEMRRNDELFAHSPVRRHHI